MRYAQIRSMDISNGNNIGISIFVQGCKLHCFNCFNQELWDYYSGKVWTERESNIIFDLLKKSYIKRISFLGGDPLYEYNLYTIYHLIKQIKNQFPQKTIWLYTGYIWEEIFCSFPRDRSLIIQTIDDETSTTDSKTTRRDIVSLCDVVVDGRYIDSLRDITLRFRGSSNQRVIDVKKTLEKMEQGSKEVVLWCD